MRDARLSSSYSVRQRTKSESNGCDRVDFCDGLRRKQFGMVERTRGAGVRIASAPASVKGSRAALAGGRRP